MVIGPVYHQRCAPLSVPRIQSCNRIDMTEFPYFAPSGLLLSYETGPPEQREKW